MRRLDGVNLRKLRKSAGYTLGKLAGEVGVSPGYLGNIEHGRRASTFISLLDRIAIAYGMHLNITLTRKEDGKKVKYELWSDK